MRIPAVRAALLLALAASLCRPTPAASAGPKPAPSVPARPWTIDDLFGVRTVSDPQVSADGRWLAWVVQELSSDSTRWQSDVWVSPVARYEPRRLTTAPGNDDTPRWSPDGRWLAFLSDRPQPAGAPPTAGRQLWRIQLEGGEAEPVGHAAGGVMSPQWSADGSFLAFLSLEPDPASRRAPGDDTWTPDARRRWSRLWTLDVASGRAVALTRGESHVTSFSIAPDGRRIVYAAQPTPALEDATKSDLWLVPTAGGTPTPLVRQAGEDVLPSFSPDGRWVAFIGQGERETAWWGNRSLFVINAAGGRPASLTESFDESVEGVRDGEGPLWMPDGETLLFMATTRTDRRIYRAFADGRPVDPVMKPTGVDAEPSLGGKGTVLAWTHEEPTQAREVWVWEMEQRAPQPFTVTNPQLAGRPAIDQQVVTWTAADGRQIEGLLMSPARPRAGTRTPLLVVLHGGPAWTHLAQFSAGHHVYPYPLLVQAGWSVLRPNPRGSAGYGEAFRAANLRDWGGLDADDVLAGIDQLVRAGFVDERKLAVCGWSYGGFLAATLVTRTDRFKAAIVGAGMTDLPGLLASDVPGFTRSYMGSWPWEDAAAWAERSPLRHAGAVRTPTAFVHGADDDRVPLAQATVLWRALRERGVPTELLVLPHEGHIPLDPRHQRAALRFHLDWLTKWTLNPPGGSPAVKAPTGGAK